MENIKTIKKGNYTLTHDRFIDDMGFLVDIFCFSENKDGKKINMPFLPPIKNIDRDNIMDRTSNYSEQEYQKMFKEIELKVAKIKL